MCDTLETVYGATMDSNGTTLLEYTLIVALMILVSIASIRVLSRSISDKWTTTSNTVVKAIDNGEI